MNRDHTSLEKIWVDERIGTWSFGPGYRQQDTVGDITTFLSTCNLFAEKDGMKNIYVAPVVGGGEDRDKDPYLEVLEVHGFRLEKDAEYLRRLGNLKFGLQESIKSFEEAKKRHESGAAENKLAKIESLISFLKP